MAPVRSITDLLREQPEDDLRGMADGLRAEIERLQVELEIVESALNRRARPRSTAPRGPRSSRSPGLKRAELLAIIREQGRPVRPAEMQEILEKRGIHMATTAVRTAMGRLMDDQKLVRVGEGIYMVNPALMNVPDGNEADSPLSRVGSASGSGEGSRTDS